MYNGTLPFWLRMVAITFLVSTGPACGGKVGSEEQPKTYQCPADCSGHGTCGVVVTPGCWELGTCDNSPAQCLCDLGYAGEVCDRCALSYVPDEFGQCVRDYPNRAPTNPSDPEPPDGSFKVDPDVILGWSCSDGDGDPLTYDVYFGTTEDPPLVAADLTTPTFDPGELEYATRYFWRAVCKDGEDERGSTWGFRTVCRPPAPCPGTPTVTDGDGIVYTTVEICGQCWMAKNLCTGQTVPLDNSAGAGQYLADDGTPVHFTPGNATGCSSLGGLYYWDEAMNFQAGWPRGICPAGWHVPTDAEWQTLEVNLGMSPQEAASRDQNRGTDQGTQLKVGGAAEFDAPNAGYASVFFGHFDFANQGSSAVYWTSTSVSADNAWFRKIDATDAGIDRSLASRLDAYSVRCVKD